MESYEEFCCRVQAKLHRESEVKPCCTSSSQQGVLQSIIQFYGVALLSPLLSEQQRKEMKEHRQRAVQLESERHSQRKACLLARVQGILDSVQVCKTSREMQAITPPTGCSWDPESTNNMNSPQWNEKDAKGAGGARRGTEHIAPTYLNGMKGTGEEQGEEEDEEIDMQSLSLQVLLRRSKERFEEEQARKGSQINSSVTPVHILEDGLYKQASGDTGAGAAAAGHSPGFALSPIQLSSTARRFPDSVPGCSPCSLAGSYAQLPSPDLSQSPRPHRRRPRPVSAGNILISCPMSAAELSPQKGQQEHPLAAWEAGPTAVSSGRSPVDPSSPASCLLPSPSCAWHCSISCASPDLSSISPAGTSPQGQDGVMPSFRRRSHTFDMYITPQGSAVEWSRERVPRFLGGQLQPTPSRRSPPAPLNRSYDVESPSPMLQRPHVTSEPVPRDPLEVHRGSQEGKPPGHLATSMNIQDTNAGTVQEQVQILEQMQRRLQEEHAQQLSLLIAEQEWEQQRLQQELEKGRRLSDQPGELTEGLRPDRKALSERCSPLNPVCYPNGSPGLSDYGYPSVHSVHTPSPSAQSPVHLWGISWGPGSQRGRKQVLTPKQQRAVCRLGAMVRGFLTRRLLNTEKVKHLCQTVQDTREFIRSFQSEVPGRRGSLSAQDQSLQARVRAQLHAALFDIHDIFFVMPLSDRLVLLRQDRELRAERKLREMDKARSPKDRVTLSAATQKSLDRKKQRVTDMSGQGKRTQHKPKSPVTKRISSRILQPNQGQNTAMPGQLLRQGSLYRKTPEERVKRCDALRKQHSLG